MKSLFMHQQLTVGWDGYIAYDAWAAKANNGALLRWQRTTNGWMRLEVLFESQRGDYRLYASPSLADKGILRSSRKCSKAKR
jgi:predicted aminopeptidase